MRINVILTSYNRPFFLERSIWSLLGQTDKRWICYLMDDNSNDDTLRVIEQYAPDLRMKIFTHNTTEWDRRNTTRYSALINEILPEIKDGIIGYMCDNVEYQPDLVKTVLNYFDKNQDVWAGYVPHERDAWSEDGKLRYGAADYFNHWNRTPPFDGEVPSPVGLLDHSQVFHRVTSLRWPTEAQFRAGGDGEYFSRLVAVHGPIQQITRQSLTVEHLFR